MKQIRFWQEWDLPLHCVSFFVFVTYCWFSQWSVEFHFSYLIKKKNTQTKNNNNTALGNLLLKLMLVQLFKKASAHHGLPPVWRQAACFFLLEVQDLSIRSSISTRARLPGKTCKCDKCFSFKNPFHCKLPSNIYSALTCWIFCQKGRPFELAVDVGCGSGQGTLLLAGHFACVVGTDVSPAQLEVALQHAKEPNITYK